VDFLSSSTLGNDAASTGYTGLKNDFLPHKKNTKFTVGFYANIRNKDGGSNRTMKKTIE
jgi:hypothetical protein